MAFRFIHTADLHLDSPLKALRRRNADLAEAIGVATRTAFERIVDRAVEEGVNALVIAGDLYDGTTRDVSTGLYLADCIRRLGAAGVHTLIILGNHDAESVIKPPFASVDHLTVFKPKASTVRFVEAQVAFHGASFRDPQVPEDMTGEYPEPVPGWVNIGLLHTSLGGYVSHAAYAPTTPARLTDKGYDYWALGHVHKGQVVQAGDDQRPWIIYPGIPQGRDMGETGAGQAVLGTVEDDRVAIEWFDVSPVVLERVRVSLPDVASVDDVRREVRTIVEAVIGAAGPEQSIIRPEIEVPVFLVPALHQVHDELLDLVQTNVQARAGRIAIEKVGVVAAGEVHDGIESHNETLVELIGLVRDHAAGDVDLVAEIVKDLEGVLSKLPPDIRSDPEMVNPLTALDPDRRRDVGAWLEMAVGNAAAVIAGPRGEERS